MSASEDDRLTRLEAMVAAQSQEIAALRAALAPSARSEPPEPPLSRRAMVHGLAAATLGTAALGLSGGRAEAANGDALIAGEYRTATVRTALVYTGPTGDGVLSYGFGVVDGSLSKFSVPAAVAGHAGPRLQAGVYGYGEEFKTGVAAYSDKGAAIEASSDGDVAIFAATPTVSGSAVYGTASNGIGVTGSGVVGVFGATSLLSVNAAGVHAAATAPSAALRVNGKIVASAAKVAKIAAGGRSVSIPVTGFTSKTIVLATIQNRGASSLAVSSVVMTPTNAPTRIVIGLTGPAPTGGVTVGWIAIDRVA